MLTGRVIARRRRRTRDSARSASAWSTRLGEPVIRHAVAQAMRIMGGQFVLGRTIEEALERAATAGTRQGWRYSFDMLGEAARTAADAERYFDAYADAIAAIGTRAVRGRGPIAGPGISVKLSALHPRYEVAQAERVRARARRRA